MNKIFFFYPHCYLKSTDDEILVFDTFSKRYVYIKNYILSKVEKDALKKGFFCISDEHNDFINQCIIKNLGYYIDYEKVSPFMYNRELNIVSSLFKEKKALGYNLYSSTNLLLKEVTIFFNNYKENISIYDSLQMEYPQYNHEYIDVEYILSQLSSFPCIENIILSGEVVKSSLIIILNYAIERDIHVTHRILFSAVEDINSLTLLDEYENLSIELLVDSSTYGNLTSSLMRNKLYIKAIIRSIEDLERFQSINNIVYLPVLSVSHDNKEILHQMILSEEEILKYSKSLNDCLLSDYINSTVYGHIVIGYDAKVFCMSEFIDSLHDTDLPSIINTWIGKKTCRWYYTRKKKKVCANCALQCFCPPISIQEELGFYKCSCKI